MVEPESVSVDNFKPVFKHFRSLLGSQIGAEVMSDSSMISLPLNKSRLFPEKLMSLFLRPSPEWRAYDASHAVKGLMVLRDVFTEEGQVVWATRCLREYTIKPHRTNLDASAKSRPMSKSWFAEARGDARLCDRLRWSTLGVHHNWDTKHYDFGDTSPFPSDLADLCCCLIDAVIDNNDHEFRAEAAIVNFYPPKTTLSPHTDHSEPNQSQSAVFLIGGATRSTPPTALLLQSGDVVIMSGDSRRAFHAVPKIVQTSENPWHLSSSHVSQHVDAEFVRSYLDRHRINVNVRQVH